MGVNNMDNDYIVMIYCKNEISFYGRKEYLSGGHSNNYNHDCTPARVVEKFQSEGISLDKIYFYDGYTRVRYFNSLPQ